MRALSAVERLGPRRALGIVFAARPELRTRTKRALTAVGLMALTRRLRRSKRGSCRSQTNVVLTLSPYLMLEAPVALVVLLLARRRILGIVAGVWDRYPLQTNRPVGGFTMPTIGGRFRVPGVSPDPTVLAIHVSGPVPQSIDA